ncbi:MAG: hypothetical protein IJW45_07860, partial [Oscillospiraceae bacterium]|nr:hypothetical protein [Oscillospiraceae bacterium]
MWCVILRSKITIADGDHVLRIRRNHHHIVTCYRTSPDLADARPPSPKGRAKVKGRCITQRPSF